MSTVETTILRHQQRALFANQQWVRFFIIWASRLTVGGVFLFAATMKIINPGDFAEQIFHYQILPDVLVNPTAIILPWLELVVAISLLVVPSYRKTASLCLILMLVIFIMAQGSVLARGLHISCGCFASSDGGSTIGWFSIGRNLALIFLSVLATLSVGLLAKNE